VLSQLGLVGKPASFRDQVPQPFPAPADDHGQEPAQSGDELMTAGHRFISWTGG
jgi:hypothetical protein